MASRKSPSKKRNYGTKLKPQKGPNPENRPFSGREKNLQHAHKLSKVLTAALDILARFRATQQPIQKILQPILNQRRFGAKERNEIRDWIFSLQRQKNILEVQLDKFLTEVGGVPPNRRQKDLALLIAIMSTDKRVIHQEAAKSFMTSSLHRFLETLPCENNIQQLPSWLREKLQNQFGTQAPAIEKAFLQKAHPAFALDPKIISRHDLLTKLNAETERAMAFEEVPDGFWCKEHFPLSALPDDIKDAVWPMDLGSQLIAHLLGVQPSDQVLDMCAGGGGKTKAVLRKPCQITATDISPQRIAATQKRTQNKNVTFHCLDMSQPQLKAESFDRILIDAPCSGIGTIRRHPDILERCTPDKIDHYVSIQKQLLQQAHRLCKKNGYVLYATCSFLAEENEQVVQWAQKSLPLQPINLDQLRPEGVLKERPLQRPFMYILPHEFLSDAFFLAAFQKK